MRIDVALQDGEHEGAVDRVGLDQAADVDVALGDDAVERRHHALVGLLLLQHLQLRLLGHDIGLGDAHRGVVGPQGLHVDRTLLLGIQPSLTSGSSRRQVTLASFWLARAC